MKGNMLTSDLEERFRKLEKRIEELEDTVEVLSDPETMEDIKEALADLKAGRYKIFDDVDTYLAELGSSS